MDTNKILSADLLDLVFDNRNKDYGAYELRKTYHNRITKSLIFTGVFVTLIFTGVVLANKDTKDGPIFTIKPGVTISDFIPEEKKPEPIAEPQKKPEPLQIKTEKLTPIVITKNEEVVEPPPTQSDLTDSQIGLIKKAGVEYDGTEIPSNIGEGKEIIEEKIIKQPEGPFEKVEIDAKFDGNWEKFLLRNLNPQTPIDNDAPPGSYKVWIQFIVDVDGTVSDIKALTNIGYGLEQEAIRVIQKTKKWEPAIQNGQQVKAYRKQAITFQVTDEG